MFLQADGRAAGVVYAGFFWRVHFRNDLADAGAAGDITPASGQRFLLQKLMTQASRCAAEKTQ